MVLSNSVYIAGMPGKKDTPDTPDFWLEDKMFHSDLCFLVIMSPLYICFTCYYYINHWFIHLSYILCMMNVMTREDMQREINELLRKFRTKMAYFLMKLSKECYR